jgi:hypothetical protein
MVRVKAIFKFSMASKRTIVHGPFDIYILGTLNLKRIPAQERVALHGIAVLSGRGRFGRGAFGDR